MLFQTTLFALFALATSTAIPSLGPRLASHSKHVEVLAIRTSLAATPRLAARSLTEAACIDTSAPIVPEDETVAQLNICGGIAGASEGCKGDTTRTEGAHRSAHFTVYSPDGIAVGKEAWVMCVQQAREVCPQGSLSAVCEGLAFTLTANEGLEL